MTSVISRQFININRRRTRVLGTLCGTLWARKMSGKYTTLFEDLGSQRDPEVVNLSVGAPGPKQLQRVADMANQSTQSLMKSPDGLSGLAMQYGPRLGSPIFREELAKFLSEGYGDTVKSENVLATGGATVGFHWAASTFLRSGAPVFVEDPTYFLAINMMRDDMGMNVVPVKRDEFGTDVDDLDRKLTEYRAKGNYEVSDKMPFWSLVYLITVFHNPTGTSLPADRCRRLVEVARKHDVLLVAEDVYNLLNYNLEAPPPPRLLTYDNPSDPDYKGHVLSNGTFSKILSPGMRVGWMETNERIIKKLNESIMLIGGGCASHYSSQVIQASLQMGLEQEYLLDLRKELGSRMNAVCKLLKTTLPETVRVYQPTGGYFIWIEMPEGTAGSAVTEHAMKNFKVGLIPGSRCSPIGGFTNCLRISVAYYEEDVLLDAVEKLCVSIKTVMNS